MLLRKQIYQQFLDINLVDVFHSESTVSLSTYRILAKDTPKKLNPDRVIVL